MGRWNDGKLEYWNGWPTIKAVFQIASLHYSNIPSFQYSNRPERYNSSRFVREAR